MARVDGPAVAKGRHAVEANSGTRGGGGRMRRGSCSASRRPRTCASPCARAPRWRRRRRPTAARSPSICSARCGPRRRGRRRRGGSSRTATTRGCRRGRRTAGGWRSRRITATPGTSGSSTPTASGLQQITSGPFDDREPHWSPDGTRLAFSSDRGGNYDIWIVTAGDRRGQPPDERRRQRHHAGVVARRPRDCVRLGPRGAAASTRSRGRRRRAAPGADASAVAAPSWTPDGTHRAPTVADGAVSAPRWSAARTSPRRRRGRLPVPRRSGSSATELLYTADGMIKRRPRRGRAGAHASRSRPTSPSRGRRSRPRDGASPTKGRSRCAA